MSTFTGTAKDDTLTGTSKADDFFLTQGGVDDIAVVVGYHARDVQDLLKRLEATNAKFEVRRPTGSPLLALLINRWGVISRAVKGWTRKQKTA